MNGIHVLLFSGNICTHNSLSFIQIVAKLISKETVEMFKVHKNTSKSLSSNKELLEFY